MKINCDSCGRFQISYTSKNDQKLELLLISHAIEYDIYKITAMKNTIAFENTVASTIEKTYSTSGGAKQMLVIDRSKWTTPERVTTLIPKI